MFPNEKARLMRMMDSYGIPDKNASGAKMDFTQRVEWLIEYADQQRVQAETATPSLEARVSALEAYIKQNSWHNTPFR